VGGEPDSLFLHELGGGFAEVADCLEGKFARDVVGFVVCGSFESCGPALGGAEEFGESLAQVAVGRAVVVEIIVKLVGDVSELFEEIVDVLLPAGFARPCGKGADGLGTLVQKLDENENAVTGDVGGVPKLLDFGVRERGAFALGVEGLDKKQKESEGEEARHLTGSLLGTENTDAYLLKSAPCLKPVSMLR
jgi:hypothetical protein